MVSCDWIVVESISELKGFNLNGIHFLFPFHVSSVIGACNNSDCFDCDPCLQYSYDCQSCVANGCHFCPGDAICQSQPLGESYWTQFNGRKVSSCPTLGDWTTVCDTTQDFHVWSDPLYAASSWIFDLINVQSVWLEGVTGKNVHGRFYRAEIGLELFNAWKQLLTTAFCVPSSSTSK
jgi:hypothetical protein